MAKMKHNRRYNKDSVKRLRKRLQTAQNKKPINRAYREMSSLEKAIAILLDEVGVEWLREHPLPYIKGQWRYYDFYLPQHNLLIEVDGDYWHSSQGKPSWVILAAKKNDMLKNWIAKKEGYRLIRIREKEIQENFSLVRERITEELS